MPLRLVIGSWFVPLQVGGVIGALLSILGVSIVVVVVLVGTLLITRSSFYLAYEVSKMNKVYLDYLLYSKDILG